MPQMRANGSESMEVNCVLSDAVPSLPRGLRGGDTLRIRIQTLSKKGDGRSEVSVRIGPQRELRTYQIEVRRALPDELVDVQLEARRRLRFSARVVRRLEEAVDRVPPRCAHFGEREVPGKGCGGCSLQSLAYHSQLTFKSKLVEEHLRAAGLDRVEVHSPIGMEEPFDYRNKMEFSFGDDRARAFACGLYPQGWHNEVIAIETCHLQSRKTDRIRRVVATTRRIRSVSYTHLTLPTIYPV